MSEKHTPGPWKSTKDGRIYSETATEWNRTANAEAAAWVAATGENPANARLIAAAPDLLAALENVVQWDTEAIADDPVGYDTALYNAAAAIKRAKGKKP